MWHRTDNFRQGRVHPTCTSRVRITYLGKNVLGYDQRHTSVATDFTMGFGEILSAMAATLPGANFAGYSEAEAATAVCRSRQRRVARRLPPVGAPLSSLTQARTETSPDHDDSSRVSGRSVGGSRFPAFEHVERPQLARGADRSRLAMLRVTGREVRAFHPGLEVGFGAPPGEHQAELALVVGTEQLESLEAVGLVDSPRPRGEPPLELVEAIPRDGDGVDLDDAHDARW